MQFDCISLLKSHWCHITYMLQLYESLNLHALGILNYRKMQLQMPGEYGPRIISASVQQRYGGPKLTKCTGAKKTLLHL